MQKRSKQIEQRVDSFRNLVRAAIEKADAEGKPLRPYEGAMSLSWPAMVRAESVHRDYTLHLSCCVLGRATCHHAWHGSSWKQVFERATRDVTRWTAQIGDASEQ